MKPQYFTGQILMLTSAIDKVVIIADIAPRSGRFCKPEPTEYTDAALNSASVESTREVGEPFPVVTSNFTQREYQIRSPYIRGIHAALCAGAYKRLIDLVVQFYVHGRQPNHSYHRLDRLPGT